VIILLILLPVILSAQPVPYGGDGYGGGTQGTNPVGGAAPVGGGLPIMLVMAAGYVLRKYRVKIF
jgi:hypothetical protein